MNNERNVSVGFPEKTNPNPHRCCLFGCHDRSIPLRRFPIQDFRRCKFWIQYFKISDETVKQNALANLRICLKHFPIDTALLNEEKIMANQPGSHNQSLHLKKAIKRSASLSSTSSASSTHSHSKAAQTDPEAKKEPYNRMQSVPELVPNLPNRKVFMITQKSESVKNKEKKCHMYLIIEDNQKEKVKEGCAFSRNGADEEPPSKKLTLYTDRSQSHLLSKIGQILPQIISRIQAIEQRTEIHENASMGITQKMTFEAEAELKPEIPTPIKYNSMVSLSNKCEKKTKMSSSNGTRSQYGNESINLSADFFFLMKILPKLEKIPEPRKRLIKVAMENLIRNSDSSKKHMQ